MTETVTDPICGMTIDPDGAVASEKHAGRVRPVLRRLAWLVVLAVAVTACGDGSSDEVASFQEIATAGPSVEPDPSGTAAVLSVETSIDAVCAVSYGIGEPVGRIATDREMNPEGHSLHRVVLSGLEPDTEYSYRLQGVGSDGRLYRSDVFTFRTPEASTSAPGRDLTVGATVVEASSEFSSSFAGTNALDGDLGTEWSSRGDGDDAFITIDLGQEEEVGAVVFRTREMSDGTATTETFTVTVDDGETFGPFPAGAAVAVDFRGRLLRFDVARSTGGNTGAVEIELYGKPPG
jgi:hypothetical protein